MEVFGKFWAIILSFLIIFICPIYLAKMRSEMLMDIAIINNADIFIDKVKYCGYIERSDLNNFYTKTSLLDGGRKIQLVHRRRAVRPIYSGSEIVDTKDFYIDVLDNDIKNSLKNNNKYRLKIGDEITVIIEKNKGLLSFLSRNIELGGMVENEAVTS